MFLTIRADRAAGDRVLLDEIHVAVEDLSSRAPAREDALGGDSWARPAGGGLSVTVRAFRRPALGKWLRPRTRG